MFKKYPFVRQNNLKDCAAASVMMIVKYYKGNINMNKLIEMLKITRKGTTAYHIVETLKELGFNAYGKKEQKLDKTKIPFIANVIINNSYKHFVVVYEVQDKYVLLADPSDRIKKISIQEFKKIWTGINILMYPEKPIVRIKNQNYLKIIKKIITPNLNIIIKIGFLSLIMTITGIIGSFFFQKLIDNLNNNIKLICLIFVVITIIKILSNYLRNKLLIKFINITDNYFTKNTFKQIIILPYIYYHNHTTGEIVSKINDLNIVRDTISKLLITLFIDLPLTLFSGILLYSINKILFLIIILTTISYIIIIKIFHKRINININKTLNNKANLNSYMIEAISGFKTIQGLNLKEKINKIFETKHDKYLNQNLKLENTLNNQILLKDIISNICNITILIIGIYFIKESQMSLSIFITYNILTNLFLDPIRNIIDLDFEMKEVITTIKRVLDLSEDTYKQNDEKINLIEFRNMSYTFDDENYILKNINLKINKGEKIIISGKSGSGKSTLLKILKGYYLNYEGKVLINNKPINACYNKINYITGKETIFTTSIQKNIEIKGSKDLNKIKQMCYLDEIAQENDLGYHTLLEENGFNISDGQKQRIVLARSLQDFSLLIIDEGLNALDINLEREILKNLFKYYKDKTIIVISHRLNNLDLFDRFIKLEDGQLTLDNIKEKDILKNHRKD
ncbi:MAG: peptidase domain-containing ABC transporter [Bacilli bacterium]|nr:peptidase domain-containing ABC transporter [Bacilli bacterium]